MGSAVPARLAGSLSPVSFDISAGFVSGPVTDGQDVYGVYFGVLLSRNVLNALRIAACGRLFVSEHQHLFGRHRSPWGLARNRANVRASHVQWYCSQLSLSGFWYCEIPIRSAKVFPGVASSACTRRWTAPARKRWRVQAASLLHDTGFRGMMPKTRSTQKKAMRPGGESSRADGCFPGQKYDSRVWVMTERDYRVHFEASVPPGSQRGALTRLLPDRTLVRDYQHGLPDYKG